MVTGTCMPCQLSSPPLIPLLFAYHLIFQSPYNIAAAYLDLNVKQHVRLEIFKNDAHLRHVILAS
jgi:hypothetical protein